MEKKVTELTLYLKPSLLVYTILNNRVVDYFVRLEFVTEKTR